ncbi:uncharacterized protein LOC107371995 [Tetranychus urticae]|uniref:BACK domain-containing protein n=1 Tax=Tetranychus urticae TaxID=32264 RepID=T1JZY6_TETUR|nr:uncharacterized protein LOC107371995 [Tetranychus urticae]
MTQIESADQIELINRSSSYTVSKSLICAKIPFFNELCSSQGGEKFQVNLNESSLESVINWVHSDCIVINMNNVLQLYEAADDLQIASIKSLCQLFFDENFSAKEIPALIKLVRDDNSLLNFNKINSFLSRNFLRLINGEYFLEFPLEVVKYILSLDTCVETEYSVFQAILKWIKHDKLRGVHLQELMKCIRWCHTFKDCYVHIKEDEFIVKNLPQLDELACEPGECRNSCFNKRVKEKNLISLLYVDDNIMSMSYYTGDNCWEPCGTFERDNQMPIGVISEEHVVDVIFNSGRTGIRIDLVGKKYRWLEMSGSSSAYYNQLYDCFKPKFDRESSYRAYIQDGVKKIDHWVDLEKNTLIENKGVMNIICYPRKDEKLYCFLPVEHVDWYKHKFADHRVHAVILNDACYIITKSLTFRIFDMVKKTIEKSKPFDGMNYTFEDLQLDSHEANVILLIKSQKKVMMFDTRKKEWTSMGQIFSRYEIMALVSTDIPVQFIKKLYSKKRVK